MPKQHPYTTISDILETPDLSDKAKIVLCVLAIFAGKKGACWPSRERLAASVHRTPRTVSSALKELEDGGYVKRERRPRQSTLYTLHLEGKALSHQKSDKCDVDNSEKGGSVQDPDVKDQVSLRGKPFHIDTILYEQPIEQPSTTPPTPSYPDRGDVDNPASKNGGNTHLKISFDRKPDGCMLNRLRHYRWQYRAGTWSAPATPANREILAEALYSYEGHVDIEEMTGCPNRSL